jgi:ABC-type multidrug transport system fused ATPase/permease subunit
VSDITGDSNYKATWRDLLAMCYPDLYLICVAFVFLLLAAVAQVFIPKFLGKILDALTSAFADQRDGGGGDSRHKSMFEIPGFLDNVKLLVVASVLAGVFAGIRGSIFTVVGGRVNVRLRIQLMDSLLAQDIGFFDVTKTGDITSRLSSDTTLVGDQVSLNVNVFLRSLVQAAGVLLFMFLVSWQLSILAFISVPLITVFSRWYGEYIRSLTKLMQKKLADGNSVCEAALGAMSTVRVFDAAEAELSEFESCMKNYLQLNTRSAIAYCGYATFVTSLPQLVFAVVGTCYRKASATLPFLLCFQASSLSTFVSTHRSVLRRLARSERRHNVWSARELPPILELPLGRIQLDWLRLQQPHAGRGSRRQGLRAHASQTPPHPPHSLGSAPSWGGPRWRAGNQNVENERAAHVWSMARGLPGWD